MAGVVNVSARGFEKRSKSLGCEVGVDEAGAGKEDLESEMTSEGRDSAGSCDGRLGSGGVPVGWGWKDGGRGLKSLRIGFLIGDLGEGLVWGGCYVGDLESSIRGPR